MAEYGISYGQYYGVPELEYEEIADDLAGGLPAPFPSDRASGNWKLQEPAAQLMAQFRDDAEQVDQETTVQDAEHIESLAQLAELVDLPPRTGESLAKYRARLISEYNNLTGRGTIRGLLTAASELLNTDADNLQYSEPAGGEPGTVELRMPRRVLDDSLLTDQEVIDVLERTVSASYRLEGAVLGSFTYITPADYNAGAFDAASGYDGLDANGDPKDNGGTYAGLL
jgi:hypothetical protein